MLESTDDSRGVRRSSRRCHGSVPGVVPAAVAASGREAVLREFLDRILGSASECPPSMGFVCTHLREIVRQRFPKHANVALASFLFLRYFCPAIVDPMTAGVGSTISKRGNKDVGKGDPSSKANGKGKKATFEKKEETKEESD